MALAGCGPDPGALINHARHVQDSPRNAGVLSAVPEVLYDLPRPARGVAADGPEAILWQPGAFHGFDGRYGAGAFRCISVHSDGFCHLAGSLAN